MISPAAAWGDSWQHWDKRSPWPLRSSWRSQHVSSWSLSLKNWWVAVYRLQHYTLWKKYKKVVGYDHFHRILLVGLSCCDLLSSFGWTMAPFIAAPTRARKSSSARHLSIGTMYRAAVSRSVLGSNNTFSEGGGGVGRNTITRYTNIITRHHYIHWQQIRWDTNTLFALNACSN